MFALGTDSFVVAGVLPEIARSFDVSIVIANLGTAFAPTFGIALASCQVKADVLRIGHAARRHEKVRARDALAVGQRDLDDVARAPRYGRDFLSLRKD